MVNFSRPFAKRIMWLAIHRSIFCIFNTAAITNPPKNIKIMGSENGAKAALVERTLSIMAKIGTIREVTVILKASVSQSIPTKINNANPLFSCVENGKILSKVKNSMRSRARIITPLSGFLVVLDIIASFLFVMVGLHIHLLTR